MPNPTHRKWVKALMINFTSCCSLRAEALGLSTPKTRSAVLRSQYHLADRGWLALTTDCVLLRRVSGDTFRATPEPEYFVALLFAGCRWIRSIWRELIKPSKD